jgi:hypothetical protein
MILLIVEISIVGKIQMIVYLELFYVQKLLGTIYSDLLTHNITNN